MFLLRPTLFDVPEAYKTITSLKVVTGTLRALEGIVGKDKLVVSTSSSLLHTAVDLVFFSANAAAQASRKSSPRVNNEAVQKVGSDHRRATNVSARLDAQQKKLNLPILPTTTIGSFTQTADLRRVRREYNARKILVG
ncbi:hypothetical protein IFM89_037157 [Coptis chinensis]|uniref:Uncharacterized protein n=1 Tax=Coptis chinensis TaxID=261450 RepID=A0A835I911_9MAGN|nr:hypothetical protein IFM89_037157 [Coptis chinensis]